VQEPEDKTKPSFYFDISIISNFINQTKIENFLEQACGLELNVHNSRTIHLSSKWFHSSRAKCQKAPKIEGPLLHTTKYFKSCEKFTLK
jgi:hypothetical protein